MNIFVFGSNLAGRHGKGSALAAYRHHGAVYGQGVGHHGNSYAIPTKDGRNGANLRSRSQTLPLEIIRGHVEIFLTYAKEHPEWKFRVVAIGCSNAGYMPEQIAPMFSEASPNVYLPQVFKEVLGR